MEGLGHDCSNRRYIAEKHRRHDFHHFSPVPVSIRIIQDILTPLVVSFSNVS